MNRASVFIMYSFFGKIYHISNEEIVDILPPELKVYYILSRNLCFNKSDMNLFSFPEIYSLNIVFLCGSIDI